MVVQFDQIFSRKENSLNNLLKQLPWEKKCLETMTIEKENESKKKKKLLWIIFKTKFCYKMK